MSTLERAIAIAAAAHAGQLDKAGQPYILHPLRVMLRLGQCDERIAAVLHDVVEDTPVTLEQLRAEGFAQPVLDAVQALTKRPGETRLQAAARAAQDPVALAVKLADNAENMDLSRIARPTARDFARLEEYAAVRALLLARRAAPSEAPSDPWPDAARETPARAMNGPELAAGLAPTPLYRYAERVGDQLFVAGQVPLDAAGGLVAPADAGAQARQCLLNLGRVLAVHGFSTGDVRRLVVYVAGDAPQLKAAWEAVTEAFSGRVPPATLLGVARLGYAGQLVEIDATVCRA